MDRPNAEQSNSHERALYLRQAASEQHVTIGYIYREAAHHESHPALLVRVTADGMADGRSCIRCGMNVTTHPFLLCPMCYEQVRSTAQPGSPRAAVEGWSE